MHTGMLQLRLPPSSLKQLSSPAHILLCILTTFIFHRARMLTEISAIFMRRKFGSKKAMTKNSSAESASFPIPRISLPERSAREIELWTTEPWFRCTSSGSSILIFNWSVWGFPVFPL